MQLCRSRLPGVPQRVKEGMIYFGVRLVPGSGGDTGTLKPTAGVGYSDSSRASAFHDFSVPDARFKKHVETFARFLQLAKTATSVMLQRIQHVEMSAWLWQYVEEELPIFRYEEVHDMVGEALRLIREAGGGEEEGLRRVEEIYNERARLLRPEREGKEGGLRSKRKGTGGAGCVRGRHWEEGEEGEDEEEGEEGEEGLVRRRGRGKEYVFSVEEDFVSHYFMTPAHGQGGGGEAGGGGGGAGGGPGTSGGGTGAAASTSSAPSGPAPPPLSRAVMKRIMLEVENLKDHLRNMTDGQIFVCFSEVSLLLWKVLFLPSSGTPYFGGCFEFHLSIPPDYPNHPPKCVFVTTGGGEVRFNPNLYHNGKGDEGGREGGRGGGLGVSYLLSSPSPRGHGPSLSPFECLPFLFPPSLPSPLSPSPPPSPWP